MLVQLLDLGAVEENLLASEFLPAATLGAVGLGEGNTLRPYVRAVRYVGK